MSPPDPAAADDPFATSPTPPPAPAPAPVRKSLFKNRATRTGAAATAAAATPAAAKEEGARSAAAAIGFFSRAKDVYAENMAGERRERERERIRKEEKEKRERDGEVGSGSEEGGRRKRSRSEDRDGTSDLSEMPMSSRSIDQKGDAQSVDRNSTTSPTSSQQNTLDTAHVVSLSSDDDEDTNDATNKPYPTYPPSFSPPQKPRNTNSNSHNGPIPIDIPSDDDENNAAEPEEEEELYPDLIAAARLAAPSRLPFPYPTSTSTTTTNPTTTPTPPPPAQDPILSLLITSRLPHTTPLLIRRRLSQRLKDVRLAWCSRQLIDNHPMSAADIAGIFLTWKGRRVWDVTTCGSMGVTVGRHGVAVGRVLDDGGVGGADGAGGGDVHLEAWTREAFEAYQAEQSRRGKLLLRESGGTGHDYNYDDDDGAETNTHPTASSSSAGPGSGSAPSDPPATKLRIVLRAKGMEEVKLMVKTTTKIEALVAAFRSQREVGAERAVELWFDGERLDEEGAVVADADLEDLSGVDVVVR